MKNAYSERIVVLKVSGWTDAEAGRHALDVTMSHFEEIYVDLVADTKEILLSLEIGNAYGLNHEEHLSNVVKDFREDLLNAEVVGVVVEAIWEESSSDGSF